MPDYASPLYWQERYSHDPTAIFDWYMTYDDLKPHLLPVLSGLKKSESEIFIPGCGNSSLGALISQVQDRYSDLPEMDFSVLDVCEMKGVLPDSCFDVIIDKALMDSILCGEDASLKIHNMVAEMHRILKPGGTYVVISFGAPPARLPNLKQRDLDWHVSVTDIPKPKLEAFKEPEGSAPSYFMYVCKKGGRAS